MFKLCAHGSIVLAEQTTSCTVYYDTPAVLEHIMGWGEGGEFYVVYRCWYPTRCVADYCETCTVIKIGQTLATMVLLLFSVNITHFIDMQ